MRQIPPAMASKVLAAADLFAERGLDGAKMSEIAEATGIPRATLYYHFEGKEAVFAYLCTVVFDEFEKSVLDALSGPGTAAERLSRVIRAQLDIYAAYPTAFRAINLDLGRASRSPDLMRRAVRAYVQPVTALLEEGVADGSLRKTAQPPAVAAALLGSMTFAAQQSLRSITEETVTELHAAMCSLYFEGLGPARTG